MRLGLRLAYSRLATLGRHGKIPVNTVRGGARNKRGRISHALAAKQCEGIIAAVEHAQRIGLPLNRHWTVHWGLMGISDTDAGCLTGRILKLASDWARVRGLRFAWVYVREHAPHEGKGSHVHILINGSSHLSRCFSSRSRAWIRLATGRAYVAGATRSRPVHGYNNRGETDPALYRANLEAVTGYLLKAASCEAAAGLSLPRSGVGGPVIGKRCGWSENLGQASRA